MIKKAVLIIISLILYTGITDGQEIVTGLQSDPRIKHFSEKNEFVKGLTADTLELPFFDDFSGRSIFPETKKWSDNYVLINNNYTDRQITTGVATFDALDNYGRLYETAAPAGFEADRLTSQPINLNYPATDNIWLSFYYQPGGLGDMPEENDTLTLQFYAPDEDKWYSVWTAQAGNNRVFKAYTIQIAQSRFLKKGFRFRFVNYASLSSNLSDPSILTNCDQWNIDYVLLNKNRSDSDTTFADVAFRFPFRSLLKTHEAMPVKQFNEVYLQEMNTFIPVTYRNNDVIVRNVTRNFEIWDVYKNTLAKSFSSGAVNIDPLTDESHEASLIYTFDTYNTDSALFKITSWLITDEFDPKENDTIVYYQTFSNYFAYDDGSAEGGYGINGLGSNNAMVAMRFRSFTKDTLRAIRICFNDSYMNANKRSFDLMVWDDNNGTPGNVLQTREDVMVEQGDVINGFYTYHLTRPVEVTGVFYTGWRQRSETFLNAGLDVNTPNSGKQFYSMSGSWSPSQVNGTLMIRPVLGGPLTTSVTDIEYKSIPRLHFRPNPARDYIFFEPGEDHFSGDTYIYVTDLQGRVLIKAPLSDIIDISSLNEGLYIISGNRKGRIIGYNRLIKIR